jgi:hypothetical protein
MDLHILAAPQVAGVAALILSDKHFYGYTYVAGSVARDIKSIIRGLSYPRILDGPKVIWNGVDNYDGKNCLIRRGDGPGQGSTSRVAATTVPVQPIQPVHVSLYANCYTLTSSLIGCEGYHHHINGKSAYLFTDPSRHEHRNR